MFVDVLISGMVVHQSNGGTLRSFIRDSATPKYLTMYRIVQFEFV